MTRYIRLSARQQERLQDIADKNVALRGTEATHRSLERIGLIRTSYVSIYAMSDKRDGTDVTYDAKYFSLTEYGAYVIKMGANKEFPKLEVPG